MKRKLYPNVRRITTVFSIAILCMTLTTLLLRLTLFSDLAVLAASPAVKQSDDLQNDEPGLFPYSLSRNVYFATPESRGDFKISNPAANEYYMVVAVILPETGEQLLYTGFIMPGENRGELPLQIRPPEGVYDCIAEITAYDPETLRARGTEQRDITLYIGQKPK